MRQLLQFNREKKPRVVEVPEPQLKGSGVLVRNVCTLVSAGTERQMIDLSHKTLLGKARQRPDLVRQVLDKMKTEGIKSTYDKVMGRLQMPLALGYSTSGVVEQVNDALDRFSVGNRVACAGLGYASHADRVFVPANLAARIPSNVSDEDAAFVTLGAIALQGVRVADVRIGETVAVIGLGLLGQIACQLLTASGCKVIGIDIDAGKFELARKSGASHTFATGNSMVEQVTSVTAGYGVDAVIITAAADTAEPVELAGEICREKGTVVVVGAVKMDVPRRSYYNKELSLRLSRSYGPGRYDYAYEEAGNDYPFGYVRWTENRNMEAFLQLISQGKVNVRSLVTHRFSINDAEKAYDVISGNTGEAYLGVLLSYHHISTAEGTHRCTFTQPVSPTPNRNNIGFIGAGNFATGVLLPLMARDKNFKLKAIMSGSGVSALSAKQRFGIDTAVSDVNDILDNPSIGSVVIATRHNQHAHFVVESLKRRKATFVEKPLCMSRSELKGIVAAYSNSGAPLMVGFNRRFAPLVTKLKSSVGSTHYPLSMHYRINAGFIPSNSWIQDPESGGGRIIGEMCHFIDLLAFIAGARPYKVYAESLSMPDDRYRSDDNLQVMIRFEDGSVGTINYVSSGNKMMGKEYLEVLGGGMSYQLDNFKVLSVAAGGKCVIAKNGSQDKGHTRMLELWGKTLAGKTSAPIPFNELVDTTEATFAVVDSLSKGEAQWMTA